MKPARPRAICRYLGSSVILLALCAGGCCHWAQQYQKSNIDLGGRVVSGEARYDRIQIGNPRAPYTGQPEIRIVLNGEELRLSQVTPAMLASLPGVRVFPYETWDGMDMPHWSSSETCVTAHPYHFVFSGARAVELKVSHPGVIGAGTSGPLYECPLTQAQAIQLFGTPDKTEKYLANDPL